MSHIRVFAVCARASVAHTSNRTEPLGEFTQPFGLQLQRCDHEACLKCEARGAGKRRIMKGQEWKTDGDGDQRQADTKETVRREDRARTSGQVQMFRRPSCSSVKASRTMKNTPPLSHSYKYRDAASLCVCVCVSPLPPLGDSSFLNWGVTRGKLCSV